VIHQGRVDTPLTALQSSPRPMITRRAVLWLWPLAAGVVATINDGPGYGVAVFVFVFVFRAVMRERGRHVVRRRRFVPIPGTITQTPSRRVAGESA